MTYKSLASHLRTGRRPACTLVWQLEDQARHTIDCVATSGDGVVRLCLERAGVREEQGVFPDARTAVRSALDLERTLISDGWEKIV